jgi:hypothetical protein
MNCPNCGAASWSKGRCDYCWSPVHEQEAEALAVAYFRGFIDDTQRAELVEQLGLLRSGDAIVIPANVELRPLEFVNSQRPQFRGY